MYVFLIGPCSHIDVLQRAVIGGISGEVVTSSRSCEAGSAT